MLLRTFLFFIIVLGLGIGVDVLSQNPGVLTFEWYGYKVSTTAAFMLVCVAVLGLVVVMLTSLYIWLVNVPKRLHRHLKAQKQEKGFAAFNDALQALAIGENDVAISKAKYAHKHLPHLPLADTLLAEVSARKQAKGEKLSNPQEFKKLLEKPHTKVIGLRGLLSQSLENGDSKQALTYALDLFEVKPKNPFVLNILVHLYARQQQVAEALSYADKLVKVTDEKSHDYARVVFVRSSLQKLHIHQLASSGHLQEAIKLNEKALKQNATFVPLILQLAHLYDQDGHPDKAQKALQAGYKELPNLKIGRTWLAMNKNEKERVLLKKLDKFVKPHPQELSSCLLKADAYLGLNQYSETRSILAECLTKGDDKTVFELYAELESIQQPNSPHAAKWLQKALTAPDRLQAFDGSATAFDAWRRTLVESPLIHLQNMQMPTTLATALVAIEQDLPLTSSS